MLLAETSGALVAGYIIGGIIQIVVIVATVMIAVRKGHSGILYFFFSLFCGLIALIVALVIKPRPGYMGRTA